jgi:hypothetical protein
MEKVKEEIKCPICNDIGWIFKDNEVVRCECQLFKIQKN